MASRLSRLSCCTIPANDPTGWRETARPAPAGCAVAESVAKCEARLAKSAENPRCATRSSAPVSGFTKNTPPQSMPSFWRTISNNCTAVAFKPMLELRKVPKSRWVWSNLSAHLRPVMSCATPINPITWPSGSTIFDVLRKIGNSVPSFRRSSTSPRQPSRRLCSRTCDISVGGLFGERSMSGVFPKISASV